MASTSLASCTPGRSASQGMEEDTGTLCFTVSIHTGTPSRHPHPPDDVPCIWDQVLSWAHVVLFPLASLLLSLGSVLALLLRSFHTRQTSPLPGCQFLSLSLPD